MHGAAGTIGLPPVARWSDRVADLPFSCVPLLSSSLSSGIPQIPALACHSCPPFTGPPYFLVLTASIAI